MSSFIVAWVVASLAKAEDSWYIGGDHNLTCIRDLGGQLDCERGFKEGSMKIISMKQHRRMHHWTSETGSASSRGLDARRDVTPGGSASLNA
ncbi:hypothetical protein D0860_04757 [Hortaea werneckii]|uniref:Cyanovirin-N domain-containing protein n=1 Tax=Hortaea werneckii TaxID=91943 RepID=A0A3M7H4J2_HORWE|nr:hypothetical protein D0860_04757 [Hortaea werneckii]RMZ32015.1 hypothetical protein D0859_03857 [Hortaea werneckii]